MPTKFLDVIARFEADTGRVYPIYFMWNDRKIVIDKITDMRPAASLKNGGQGMRYTCKAEGFTFYLFNDENMWFIEAMNF